MQIYSTLQNEYLTTEILTSRHGDTAICS